MYEQDLEHFEKLLSERFPNHVLSSYGGSTADFILGNVQTAVVDDILHLMETWLENLEEASCLPRNQGVIPSRDWEIAKSHIEMLISEVRKYKALGTHGLYFTPTGTVQTHE